MAGNIRFLPREKSVESHGHDTVLEAGLKSGMSLRYRCSNGNCGECRAVLKSGQVTRLRNHDFHLSEAEKGQGHFLMCSNAPDGDIDVEVREAGSFEDIPEQRLEARIKSVEQVDSQVMLLHLRTPRSKRLQFLAGQAFEIGGNDGIPGAAFPVASCPCDEVNLFFSIFRTCRAMPFPGLSFQEK